MADASFSICPARLFPPKFPFCGCRPNFALSKGTDRFRFLFGGRRCVPGDTFHFRIATSCSMVAVTSSFFALSRAPPTWPPFPVFSSCDLHLPIFRLCASLPQKKKKTSFTALIQSHISCPSVFVTILCRHFDAATCIFSPLGITSGLVCFIPCSMVVITFSLRSFPPSPFSLRTPQDDDDDDDDMSRRLSNAAAGLSLTPDLRSAQRDGATDC